MKRVLACVLVASLAGCMAPDLQDAARASTPSGPAPRPVVVALLDSGINPYHAAFAALPTGGAWPEARAVPMVLGRDGDEWASRVEADLPMWEGLQPGTLYRIEGTRLMVVSFGHRGGPLVLDPTGHGTSTASVVARDAPHAILVMIQIDSRACDEPSCLVHPSVAAGMEWAADQPWIDIISVSLGFPANAPDPSFLHPDAARYAAASRRAWESGKLVVAGSGNDPTASLADFFDGPPWVVSVGGAVPADQGEATIAARGVDVAANFSTLAASHESFEGTQEAVGTSMSAPVVAATLADAIRLGRDLPPPGVERRDALRAALNATAVPFSASSWKASAPEPTLYDVVSVSNPVLVEGVQMGWGYVDAGMAPRLAEAALRGDAADPSSLRALWQARWQAVRIAYWG